MEIHKYFGESVTFNKVKDGGVFSYKGELFLKLNVSIYDKFELNYWNAVKLEDGSPSFFGEENDKDIVTIPKKATLQVIF